MTTRPVVVVVGAGPVGAAAAIGLAQRGVPVVVLDRWVDVYPQPRAVHLDDEVHRLLAALGVAEAFAAISRPGAGLRLVDRDLRVLGELARDGLSPAHGYPRANMYDQPDLERVLRERMAALPHVTFRGGVEVTGVAAGASGAVVRLRDLTTGRDETVDAAFVLGCDGANSTVRSAIGSRMEDLGFDQRWLVVDVDTSLDLRQWDGVQQVCDSHRAATYMRIGPTRYRWEFQLRDGETHEDFATVPSLLPLLEPWTRGLESADAARLELVRVTSYTFRAALADHWRRGPVFLLGDAAHLTPPFIGQGLGAGVRDAANLTWKIAGVLDGSLAADVLDSYEVERRAHGRALVELALRLGLAMTSGGRLGDLVRRAAVPALALVPEVRRQVTDSATPSLVRSSLVADTGARRRRDRLAGSLAPDTANGVHDRLDARLGGRWGIVTREPVAPSDRARLDALDVAVVEASGALAAWLSDAAAGAAVVRPDGAVLRSTQDVPSAVASVLSTVLPATRVGAVSLAEPSSTLLA